MGKLLNLITDQHLSAKRNYLERMINDKVKNTELADKYDFEYWDGSRLSGYGGYKYIDGYWTPFAKKLIEEYDLNNNSKVLEVGCGKGFLLHEIKKLLPEIIIRGFDHSKYALERNLDSTKKFVFFHKVQNKFEFSNNEFDLVLGLNVVHNLEIKDLKNSLQEIERTGKRAYIVVESYTNRQELFNLQCWATVCNSFFSANEWKYLFKEYNYNGDYEFIYFK